MTPKQFPVCQWTQNMDLCSTAWLMLGVSWAEHPREIGSSAWARDLPAPGLQTGRQQGLNSCPLKASEIFKFTKQSLPHQFCPFLFGCVLAAWLWAAVGGLSPPGDGMCSDWLSHLWNLVQILVENWTSHGFWTLNLLFLFVGNVKNVFILDNLFPLMWFPLWFSCTSEAHTEQAAPSLDVAHVGPNFVSRNHLDRAFLGRFETEL